MPLPNFFIIGAAKAGTTSLYHYLAQHPHIHMSPNKEPQFFAYQQRGIAETWKTTFGADGIIDFRQYCALFDGVKNETAIGEASTNYLHFSGTAEAIHELIPDAKHIAILRNPVDRAYSHYNNLRKVGKEPLDNFRAALNAEDSRRTQGWHPVFQYSRFGFYGEQLREYYTIFGDDRMRVFSYDDFKSNPGDLCRDVFRFLGVDAEFQPNTAMRYNVSGDETSYLRRVIQRLTDPTADLCGAERVLKGAARIALPHFARGVIAQYAQWGPRSPASLEKIRKPVPLPGELRSRLIELYRNDIVATQELTGLDLSSWLERENNDMRLPTHVLSVTDAGS